MNKRRLRSLAKFMEKVPPVKFDMSDFLLVREDDCLPETGIDLSKVGECRTACCLAGWEAVRRGAALDYYGRDVKTGEHAEGIAKKSLDLSEDEANRLFYDFEWPRNKAGNPKFKSTPRGAAKRIIHLVEKGE